MGVHRSKSNDRVWLLVDAIPQLKSDGTIQEVICTFKDITLRKQAEERENAMTELLERTNTITKTGGWEFDLNSKKILFSKEALRICDVDLHTEITPEQALERIVPEYRKSFEMAMRAAIDHGTPYDFELQLITSKGQTIWARSLGQAVQVNNKAVKLVGIFQDITAQKNTERELSKSKNLFRSYFELPFHGIAITSLDKRWIEVNDKLCSLLGYSRDEIVKKTWAEMTHPDDLSNGVDQFDLLLSGQISGYQLDKRYIRKNGESLWTHLTVGCERDTDGQIEHVIATIEDITERKKLEHERAELQVQLLHSSKQAAIETLAAGLAHEINNPLAIIVGNLEFIKKKLGKNADNVDVTSRLDKQKKAADRVASVVKSLGAFAKSDTDTIEVIDIHQVVNGTVALCESVYLSEGVSIQKRLNSRQPWLSENSGKLQQVIMNLLSNAKEACQVEKRTGVITIETTDEDNLVLLTISDNGAGIEKSLFSKIFDPFFTTKKAGKGLGLGLPTSFSLVHSFGGNLTLESELGLGSRFTIRVPAAPEELRKAGIVARET